MNEPETPLLDHPAVWHSSELFNRPDWLVTLEGSEIDDVETALRQVERAGLDSEQITAATFPLPNLSMRLGSIRDSLENGSGATLIRGFPIDRYSRRECEKIFFGLMCQVGTPVSQSAEGARLFHVRDERHGDASMKTRGPNTNKGLSFHSDRCDVISFLCLRQAQFGGENQLVSSLALYNHVKEQRPDLLKVLMEPFYYKRHNVDTGNELAYCQQPIFSFHEGHFAANLLRVLIDRAYQSPEIPNMSESQREALDYVEQLASAPEFHATFSQQRGDILLINNFVLLHRRTAFEDHPSVNLRRHLLRIWLSVPNSRPLSPWFAGNYGATAAGAVRGGMNPASS